MGCAGHFARLGRRALQADFAELLRGVAERGQVDHDGLDSAAGDAVRGQVGVPVGFSDAASLRQRAGAVRSGGQSAGGRSGVCRLPSGGRRRLRVLFHGSFQRELSSLRIQSLADVRPSQLTIHSRKQWLALHVDSIPPH